jgi:signal transduction histidine kinase
LRVADTGPGIPHEAGDHVFDAFYTVKDNRPLRGTTSTGLGLALAKHTVESQGGRIWFESEPGNGATFTIAFPVARTPRSRRARKQTTRS